MHKVERVGLEGFKEAKVLSCAASIGQAEGKGSKKSFCPLASQVTKILLEYWTPPSECRLFFLNMPIIISVYI